MNILDITNEDIARLQENKIVFGLMDERDQEILKFVGGKNAEVYTRCGFSIFCKDYDFYKDNVYRIISGYHLPAPTEAEIIAYLKASEVPPSQWHPAAQEWAKRNDGEPIWEHQHADGKSWGKTSFITTGGDELYSVIPFRLRADYGKEPEMEDYYAIPAKEPEVCVYNGVKDVVYTSPHDDDIVITHKGLKCRPFCPVCGKRIEVK